MKMPFLKFDTGMLFRHKFDIFETYRLVENNNDGTGKFVEYYEAEVLPLNRYIKYTKPKEVNLSFNEIHRVR